MIPVEMQPEPANFDAKVRQPGQLFLSQVSKPRSSEWKPYWTKSLDEMKILYRQTCAYCAQWIPHGTGRHSVDHFLPKDTYPDQAYEWENFRYVSARFNSRKGTQRILDPFQIEQDWFELDFASFLIKPNYGLPQNIFQQVKDTIKILKLNDDEDLINERQNQVCDYCMGHISFEHLVRISPFIAHELERQGLIVEIKNRLRSICQKFDL